MADRKTDRHKVQAITYRPRSEDDARWLRQEAAAAGVPVGAVLDRALATWRAIQEDDAGEISR